MMLAAVHSLVDSVFIRRLLRGLNNLLRLLALLFHINLSLSPVSLHSLFGLNALFRASLPLTLRRLSLLGVSRLKQKMVAALLQSNFLGCSLRYQGLLAVLMWFRMFTFNLICQSLLTCILQQVPAGLKRLKHRLLALDLELNFIGFALPCWMLWLLHLTLNLSNLTLRKWRLFRFIL